MRFLLNLRLIIESLIVLHFGSLAEFCFLINFDKLIMKLDQEDCNWKKKRLSMKMGKNWALGITTLIYLAL
jgi:hypothetical protein